MRILTRWYGAIRAWEDSYIAMLDTLNDGRPLDPAWLGSAYRRKLVEKLQCSTTSERRQMREFLWRLRGWRGSAVLLSLIAVDSLAGWCLHLALPDRFGALEGVLIVNALVLCLGLGIVTTWIQPGRLARFRGRALLVMPLLALVGALLGACVAGLVHGEPPMMVLERAGRPVIFTGLGIGIVYAGLLGLIVGLRNRELRALNANLVLEAEQARLRTQLTESRLRLLQAQIEPHFLFNTLGAVQQLAERDASRAATLTGHLIHFLRNSMGSFGERPVSLGEELAVIESYLHIMQSRLGSRLAFAIDVPVALRDCRLLPTMLLTFVENAIKHGIEPSPAGGTIRVAARREAGMLTIEVADTGVGMAEALGAGNGLRNVREQLALAHGDVASLALIENEPQGLIVRLGVPCEDGS